MRDQIYLPKEDASREEVLLRRQQLATSYRYSMSVAFTYTFGWTTTSSTHAFERLRWMRPPVIQMR